MAFTILLIEDDTNISTNKTAIYKVGFKRETA